MAGYASRWNSTGRKYLNRRIVAPSHGPVNAAPRSWGARTNARSAGVTRCIDRTCRHTKSGNRSWRQRGNVEPVKRTFTCGRRSRDGAAHRARGGATRSEEHTSELQSPCKIVCRLLLDKKNNKRYNG